jgi:ribonuclease M5
VLNVINEIIVVEGKRDAEAVQRAVQADCIITYGYTLPPSVIERIRHAQSRRGVIVLTDPDYAGEQIRRRINKCVSGCKHAFLTREEAWANNDIGVEQASPEVIRNALSRVRTEKSDTFLEFSIHDLRENGLVGQESAAERRDIVGKKLGIGYANAKQFLHRLNVYGVTRKEFVQALADIRDDFAPAR